MIAPLCRGITCFVLVLGFLSYPSLGHSAEKQRPNIVLFFLDDFGARDLSCYGSSFYETPNMDRLAAEGMRFTNAYSAYPRCVPSRQGLLSGKIPARVENDSKDTTHALPLAEFTFGEALQEAGYQTCYIGKWHLGKEGGDPGVQGFDTVIHSGSAGAPQSYFYPFPMEHGEAIVNPVDGQDGDYLTDRLTDKAVEYIEDRAGKPFLLVMAHYAVHTPFEASDNLKRKYRQKLREAGLPQGGGKDDSDFVRDRQGLTKTVQNNPIYAAMIEAADNSLGRIQKALEDAEVDNNTIIILNSDHGGLSTRGLENGRPVATSNLPYRQGKGSIFDGGTRVPMIVKWSGRVTPGTTSAVQVTGTDHYPSMLQMAGASLRPQQHVDGQSYLPALDGDSYQRAPMFWYKWQARPDSTGDTRAISYIDGNYKVVLWLDEELVELFDLHQDPGERYNLADAYPGKTAALLKALLKTEESVGNLREKGRKALERRLERKQKPFPKSK
ncbi:sulfatase [Bremerella sp. P1]|uniref:sulfatase n=1 Tax=Bremerella sp. P1 TaxID=3026424 RepID=UPI002368ABC8|nr:sulfatase [Bremerella sp. P1]WDI43830.1 sulfatase [Bremerella sp. P1]